MTTRPNTTKAQQTPEPWVCHKQEGGLFTVRSQTTGHQVAKDLLEGDALRIVATSDLLGWLEKATQIARRQEAGGENIPLQSTWKWFADNAHAAIRKATGEEKS